jgi:hypothetical protein
MATKSLYAIPSFKLASIKRATAPHANIPPPISLQLTVSPFLAIVTEQFFS